MTHRLTLLLPMTVLLLSACTLEPHHFNGTDLLAVDAVKKEAPVVEIKKAPVAVMPPIILEKEPAPVEITPTVEKETPPAVAPKVEPKQAPVAKKVVEVAPPAKPVETKLDKEALCKAGSAGQAVNAVLEKGDRVKINVFRENDLTATYEIDSAGQIAFPLIGKIDAANLTTSALQDVIQKKLAAGYLVKPEVMVELAPECNEK